MLLQTSEMAMFRSQRAIYIPVSLIIGCLIPWSLFVEHAHAANYTTPLCPENRSTFQGQEQPHRGPGEAEMSESEMEAVEAELQEILKVSLPPVPTI